MVSSWQVSHPIDLEGHQVLVQAVFRAIREIVEECVVLAAHLEFEVAIHKGKVRLSIEKVCTAEANEAKSPWSCILDGELVGHSHPQIILDRIRHIGLNYRDSLPIELGDEGVPEGLRVEVAWPLGIIKGPWEVEILTGTVSQFKVPEIWEVCSDHIGVFFFEDQELNLIDSFSVAEWICLRIGSVHAKRTDDEIPILLPLALHQDHALPGSVVNLRATPARVEFDIAHQAWLWELFEIELLVP